MRGENLSNYWKEEDEAMVLKAGEKYRCPDPQCACEIEVIKGAPEAEGRDLAPRCCCGKEMEKFES